jgi:hypothetical protein
MPSFQKFLPADEITELVALCTGLDTDCLVQVTEGMNTAQTLVLQTEEYCSYCLVSRCSGVSKAFLSFLLHAALLTSISQWWHQISSLTIQGAGFCCILILVGHPRTQYMKLLQASPQTLCVVGMVFRRWNNVGQCVRGTDTEQYFLTNINFNFSLQHF